MVLEVTDERDEDVERKLQDGRDRRNAVLEQRKAEVLPNRPDELLARAELLARRLDDGIEQLQREQLGAQLDRVVRWERLGQRLHRELAERAEYKEGVALDHRRGAAQLKPLEDDVEHLRERRVCSGLIRAALGHKIYVEACLDSEEEGRVVHRRHSGCYRAEHSLHNLQLNPIILCLVLACAHRLHHDVHHALLNLAHRNLLAPDIAVKNQLLDAVQRNLHNARQLGLARKPKRHEVPICAAHMQRLAWSPRLHHRHG
mmetsp:Transcript_10836/g.23611  ORF Transcript_10836/g.23611 Transcript_10836/m.23611 type:complete len:259 (+) Transcript_10836:142-918(+)